MSNQNSDKNIGAPKREQWGGRLGFVLATAGSAVGLGNIMNFPYRTGQYGGGAFLFVYIIVMLLVGATMLICDFLVGRNGKANAVASYRKIHKKFAWLGYLGMLGAVLALAYYAVFGGWMLYYLFNSFTTLATLEPGTGYDFFAGFTGSTAGPIALQAVFLLITMFIVMRGVKKGIERASKIMMPALLVIMLILMVRVLTLDGAFEGILFYLTPDFSLITFSVVAAAVGQVFFSLNVGTTGMVVYGSYLSDKENVGKSTVAILATDFAVAFLAGFIIIPSAFAFGLDPGQGPALLYVTMPELFAQMPGGAFFCFLFFILLLFASFTSSVSILEICVPYISETFKKIDRKVASIIVTLVCFIMGVPVSLGFGVWSEVRIFGMDIFTLYDNFITRISYPLTAMLTAVLVGWIWGKKNAMDAITNNGAIKNKFCDIWYLLVKYLCPVLLLLVVLTGFGIIQ